MHPSKVKSQAFTLPEMLAVIAIIVILISMLLPSLSTPASWRAPPCRSNLHQLALANRGYALDHRSRNVHERPEALNWMPKLTPYLANAQGSQVDRVRFLNSIPQFRCPAASLPGPGPNASVSFLGTATEAWGPVPAGFGRDDLIGSYGLNMWTEESSQVPESASGPGPWFFPTLIRVSEPSMSPLFADCIWDGGGWPGGNSDNLYGNPPANPNAPIWTEGFLARFAMYRHDRGVNVAFFDGSSRWVSFEGLWGLKWHNNYQKRTGPPWMPAF